MHMQGNSLFAILFLIPENILNIEAKIEIYHAISVAYRNIVLRHCLSMYIYKFPPLLLHYTVMVVKYVSIIRLEMSWIKGHIKGTLVLQTSNYITHGHH